MPVETLEQFLKRMKRTEFEQLAIIENTAFHWGMVKMRPNPEPIEVWALKLGLRRQFHFERLENPEAFQIAEVRIAS